ncbi:MAG: hypothetical protein ACRDQA_05575 [Nocardioidaceae bacterium]
MGLNLRRSGPWVGTAGMVVALWFYVFIVLVAPWWMLPVMLAVWGALFAVALRSFSRRPLVTLATPFVAMAVWGAVILAGGAFLSWQ